MSKHIGSIVRPAGRDFQGNAFRACLNLTALERRETSVLGLMAASAAVVAAPLVAAASANSGITRTIDVDLNMEESSARLATIVRPSSRVSAIGNSFSLTEADTGVNLVNAGLDRCSPQEFPSVAAHDPGRGSDPLAFEESGPDLGTIETTTPGRSEDYLLIDTLSSRFEGAVVAPAANLAAPSFADSRSTTQQHFNGGPVTNSAVAIAPNPAMVSRNHTNVVFLGDSITIGLKNGAGRAVWSQDFAPLGAVDFGIAGITTDQVFSQIQSGAVAAAAPKAIVLMIGTNNLSRGQSPATTATGISAIVNQIESKLPQTRILLMGLTPRGESAADPLRAEVAEVNRLIAPLAETPRVRFLDVSASLIQLDGTISRTTMPDFLHPSETGYRAYAAELRDALLVGLNHS